MVGYDEGQKQLTTSQYALAGAMSGIVTRLLLQPCDVVKIRLQIQLEPTNKVPTIDIYFLLPTCTISTTS